MISPSIIQINATDKVVLSSEMIMAVQINAPRIGTSGTNGVLKGLGVVLSDLLMIQTPKLVISPGIRVAKEPTKRKSRIFDL